MASRNLIVHIIGDSTGLNKALAGAEAKLSRFGGTTGKIMGGVGLAVAGGIGLAVKAFRDFDKGLDAVRAGTGKTGAELKDLQTSFRNVNRTVISSEEDVGKAVAAVSQRLGHQGKDLEHLSKQLLNVAWITKSDLNEVLDATTRTMGDWAIATDKQSKALDFLFRVSQKANVPFTDLQRILVQFGAPLRNLGFDFETSAVLIGKFMKEGVNTETVMAGLKVGLSNIVKEGKPVRETFVGLIEEIKNADETAAKAIGIENFGKRSGPDLVEAIRQGRFDGLLPLVEDLKNAKETIDSATQATKDFEEDWAIVMKGAKEKAADFISPTLDMLKKSLSDVNTEANNGEPAFNRWAEGGKVFAAILKGIGTAFVAVGTAIGMSAAWIADGFDKVRHKLDQILERLGLIDEKNRAIARSTPSSAAGAGGGFSGGGSGAGRAPNAKRRRMHSGGIVTRPTPALIGEAGPEAVIPLHQYHGGGGEAGGDIVIQIDGEVIARVARKELLRHKRRNGTTGL